MSKIENGKNGLVCAYCSKEKTEVIFVIGASSKPDWTMVCGTGKITCPDCYNIAIKEGADKIDNAIKINNERMK